MHASGESAEVQSLRDYLKNQSIIAARQSQQAAVFQQSKEQELLASLRQQQQQHQQQAALGVPENLVALQRRARLQAAQQYAAMHGPSSVDDVRQALLSRVGMGLLETPAPMPHVLDPQLMQLMLLRERLGQQQQPGMM